MIRVLKVLSLNDLKQEFSAVGKYIERLFYMLYENSCLFLDSENQVLFWKIRLTIIKKKGRVGTEELLSLYGRANIASQYLIFA